MASVPRLSWKTCHQNSAFKIGVVIFIIYFTYAIWIRPILLQGMLSTDEQNSLLQAIRHSQISISEDVTTEINVADELKYILIWTSQKLAPVNYWGSEQKSFTDNNCTYTNCYVTTNRSFFGVDNFTRFDALAFNGRNLLSYKTQDLPQKRSPHQKYIFSNLESSDNFPICNEAFDGFFNWTATYKVNSDIPSPYFLIRDMNGTVIGPQSNVKWLENMDEVDDDIIHRIENKTKAAAWFVSHCSTRGGRRKFVANLRKALEKYKLEVDEYGKCSTLQCPRYDKKCDDMLERDYFFYLSFENSFDEDYVTEKLLVALHNNVVPIVYGGADYSRFLPPGSYLNAREHTPEELADLMHNLITTPNLYRQYFKWKHYYTYSDAERIDNVCAVCAALNNKTMVQTRSTYENFREWWLSSIKKRCPKPSNTR